MKKNINYYYLPFIFLFLYYISYSQEGKIGFGTDNPEATCHVNGNMRLREPYSINRNTNIKDEYYPLYWDNNIKDIVTREMEIPYIKGIIKYINGNIEPTLINLNPEKYELLVLGVSISKSENLSEEEKKTYSVVTKNTNNGAMPIQSISLKKVGTQYSFSAKFINAGGEGLYYYDGSNIIEPLEGKKPIWEASFIAIDRNYLFRFSEITVNYQTYWDCNECGGKYGIELGKFFKEELEELNKIKSVEPVKKTVDAEKNTDLE